MNEPLVIRVNDQDEVLGFMPKLEAHVKGVKHRAVSVLVFNQKGDWLLQRRAAAKYHSPALWTNTCCSHPSPGEDEKDAAERRLEEEMGLRCNLTKAFSFSYMAHFDNGLIENELDHVFFGYTDMKPTINLNEVDEWKYMPTSALLKKIDTNPESFTQWFKIILPKVMEFDYIT